MHLREADNVFIGCGMVTEVACWMQTGERQAARIRVIYLRSMLNQDVGFFDTDAKTGDIVSSISADSLLVQDAISEKVTLNVLTFCMQVLKPLLCVPRNIVYQESSNLPTCLNRIFQRALLHKFWNLFLPLQ